MPFHLIPKTRGGRHTPVAPFLFIMDEKTLYLVFDEDARRQEHSLFAITATRAEMLKLTTRLHAAAALHGPSDRVIRFRPLTHFTGIADFEEAHRVRKQHIMDKEIDRMVTATFLV